MITPLEIGIRLIALLYCVYIVILLLLPAVWLFSFGGILALVSGVWYWDSHPGLSILGVIVGAGLIVLGIRTFIRDRRKEAEAAQLLANRMARRKRGPRLHR